MQKHVIKREEDCMEIMYSKWNSKLSNITLNSREIFKTWMTWRNILTPFLFDILCAIHFKGFSSNWFLVVSFVHCLGWVTDFISLSFLRVSSSHVFHSLKQFAEHNFVTFCFLAEDSYFVFKILSVLGFERKVRVV